MSNHFEWKKNMSVGEDHIDDQHKRLLLQINKIIEAVDLGATSQEVREAISFFDKYTEEHFSYEEDYMGKYNYPDLEEHKKKHQDFIKNNLIFKEKLNNGVSPTELIKDIEVYIGQWWMKHIGKEDGKYYTFIKNSGLENHHH
jgi:hemerythrin